ncbi:MAG: DUF350 domain-containing protein [Saprospiraceae bacterium]|nr:DUF350 domain-containing protein [Candidatus Vicinibacter affinis]
MKIEVILFLVLSVTLGVTFLFWCFKIFKKFYLNILGIGSDINLASAILMSALLYSIGSYISYAMTPLRNVYAILNANQPINILHLIGYILLFLLISTLLGLVVNYISYKTFDMLTKINEAEEIKNNNIPIALIVATVIIMAVHISKESFVLLLDNLIPYPSLIYKN